MRKWKTPLCRHMLVQLQCCVIMLLAVNVSLGETIHETVVVTANRREEPARTASQSITVIDSETLDKKQYDDLSSLLQAYGFSIASYGPGQASSQVFIRGMASNYSNPLDSSVLLLLDGAPVASDNLAIIPLDGIERIEIMRGPGAVQYGSSAIGGVINVIPRQGADKFRLSAEYGHGSWNSSRALGSLSGKSGFFDFAAAVSWNGQPDNYTTGDGKLYQDTVLDGRLGYLMNLGVNFNEENRLGAIISGAKDEGLGISQGLSVEEKYNGLGARANRVNSNADIIYAGAAKRAGLSWKARYFNAWDKFSVSYPGNFALNTPWFSYSDYKIENTQTGTGGQISWEKDFLAITAGADYTQSGYSSGFQPRYLQDDTALFGLLRLAFLDQMVVLNGGIRHDAYLFRVEGGSRALDNTSLSAGIAFNPWQWLTLKSNIAESFKVPSGIAVVGYSGANGVKGNPDLKPERGLTWDAGIEGRWRGLTAGLTYFATDYRDKIQSRAINEDGYSSIYYNQPGKSFINGLEGAFGFDLGEFYDWDFVFRPYLNFTKLFEYRDAAGERLQNTRELDASFGLNFSYPGWGLDTDLRFTYLGWQHEQNFSAEYPYPQVRSGNKLLGDFFISKTVYEKENFGKLSIKGEIRNFTNENYAYRHDYPMPGRSFYAGIRYDF